MYVCGARWAQRHSRFNSTSPDPTEREQTCGRWCCSGRYKVVGGSRTCLKDDLEGGRE
jgi:hypothetical protein